MDGDALVSGKSNGQGAKKEDAKAVHEEHSPVEQQESANGHFKEGERSPVAARNTSKGAAVRPDSIVPSQSRERDSGPIVLHNVTGSPHKEPTAYVFIQTVDGDIEKVERDVALLSPFVHREVNRHGRGYSRDSPVALPKQVSPAVLKLILEYCRFHRVSGRSDKERKIFDEKFIRLDTRVLCELTSAADSLDMKPLVDLTSRALARMIEGKTPEEIRETFHLPDDLTEEEKLEPVKNATDDPRIRLLNRLYARKRKELQDKKMTKQEIQDSNAKKDDRSVEALLQFIDGSAGSKKSRAKKKKKKGKKDDVEDHVSEDGSVREAHGGAGDENDDASVEAEELGSSQANSQRQGGARGHSRLGSWLGKAAGQDGLMEGPDGDVDERKDALESPSTLSMSDWNERMQEILALASSSQDRLQVGAKVAPATAPPKMRTHPKQEQQSLEREEPISVAKKEKLKVETEDESENELSDVVVAAAAAAAEAAAAAAEAARDAAAWCRGRLREEGGAAKEVEDRQGNGGEVSEALEKSAVQNGHNGETAHLPWSGMRLLEAQQTAAFLQAFLRRVGFDPVVNVGMRGGLPPVELSRDHVAEQVALDGRQMSMCVRLASGSIVSIAVAKPPPPGGQAQYT